MRAAPDPLDPHHNDRSAPRRQAPHPTRPPIMQLSHRPALGATHQIDGSLNRLLQLTVDLRHGQHHKPGQTPHRRRSTTLSFHPGPPSPCPEHHGSSGPRPISRLRLKIVSYSGTPRSETKSRISGLLRIDEYE